jgi:hypothetical protein
LIVEKKFYFAHKTWLPQSIVAVSIKEPTPTIRKLVLMMLSNNRGVSLDYIDGEGTTDSLNASGFYHNGSVQSCCAPFGSAV